MESENSYKQLQMLKMISEMQEYEFCSPISNQKQAGYVKLGLELIDAFGSILGALDAGSEYSKSNKGQGGNHWRWLVSAALLTDGDHLPGLMAAFAKEMKNTTRDHPLSSLRYGLHSIMESLTYDPDEAAAALENQFYAPRYPSLYDDRGEVRFNLDDYLAVFEHVLGLHAYFCLGDLADLEDYRRLMAIFASKLPDKHEKMRYDHMETLFMRQVDVDDPRRLELVPAAPCHVEMDTRFTSLLGHILVFATRSSEVVALGDSLEGRLEGVELFHQAMMAFPKDQHQKLQEVLAVRFSLYLRPEPYSGFQMIGESFFDLEDRLAPIRLLFSCMEQAGFGLDDLLLRQMRSSKDQDFPIQHNSPMDVHDRARCLGYMHMNPKYEENFFREILNSLMLERIDLSQVRWDDLTTQEARQLYHLAPCPAVIRRVKSSAIRDSIFESDLGL
ncbi:hypothetical protein [Pseudomonas sp. CFBP 13719]|uniref:hypothetical protein n=1 Tax=Pseudomonas sp. CFBP 13719 TaxID=2775303 RepID=UPI00177E81FE|nr:hypothetical protein [Pseudomonas sp. CFBP 13719]MBD8681663.1 hypothetical protein [Pseudomonas sp. CFBP 13719]